MSLDDLHESAQRLGIEIDAVDEGEASHWVEKTLRLLESLEPLSERPSDPTGDRPFHWATREEDPLNAFITFCSVSGSGNGPLEGLRVAVKDCIAVAGVPLTEGGGREPYPVPALDAVAVERLLDAGAVVVGKTNMEDMAVGTGIGSHFGPTRNPRNPDHQTGGSSSGSAAAVGAGLADVALGTDQAGSVRIPASWCGLVGMKPTHGLVPTQGMSRMDPTLDHIGPMTLDVATNARVLASLTGRPYGSADADRTRSPGRASRGATVAGIRIGLVTQSTQSASYADDVRRAFDDSVATLRHLGAVVGEASVPLWASSLPIFTGVVAHGLLGTWTSGGCGFGTVDVLDERVIEKAPVRSHLASAALPSRVLTRLLLATYVHRRSGGVPIVRALNLRVSLTRQIDACFQEHDLLMTPTVTKVADPLPAAVPSRDSLVLGGGGPELFNTVPLDLSGHPALTIPCGAADNGLPVGLQLIGPRYAEETVYMVAAALEGARG